MPFAAIQSLTQVLAKKPRRNQGRPSTGRKVGAGLQRLEHRQMMAGDLGHDQTVVQGDFNNDGYQDVATGVANHDGRSHSLRIEHLENRQLMAADLYGAPLESTDVPTLAATADELLAEQSALVASLQAGTISGSDQQLVPQDGQVTIQPVPLADVQLNAGVLTINGTDEADWIAVTIFPLEDKIEVLHAVPVEPGATEYQVLNTWTFNENEVERIEVDGRAGDDEIDLFESLGLDHHFSGEILIEGGDGDDLAVVIAPSQTEVIVQGGQGDDFLLDFTGGANHSFEGNDGDDVLVVSGLIENSGSLSGGTGHDKLYAFALRLDLDPDDTFVLDGGQGDDEAIVFGGHSSVSLGDGNDVIYAGFSVTHENTSTIHAGSGDDTVYSFTNNPAESPRSGFHTIHGEAGDDQINLVEAYVTQVQSHIVTGGSGNDVIRSSAQATIDAGDDDDLLLHVSGSAMLDAGAGNDLIHAWGGNSLVNGGANDDIISIGSGNNSVLGGTGNDRLIARGYDGYDTILLTNTELTHDGGFTLPTIQLPSATERTATVPWSGTHPAAVGAMALDLAFRAEASELAAAVEVALASDVPDTKTHRTTTYDGIETIDIQTLGGDDFVTTSVEAMAADIYLDTSDGHDRLTIRGTEAGDDLVLTGATVQYVDRSDALTGSVQYQAVEQLRVEALAGDDLVTASALPAAIGLYVEAGAGDDVVVGSDGHDVVWAGAGNDVITAGNGHDTVHGEAGDDQLFGQAGNDELNAGTGTNFVDGGADQDRLSVLGEDGSDQISVVGQTVSRTSLGPNGEELTSYDAVELLRIESYDGYDIIDARQMSGPAVLEIASGGGNDIVYGSAAADFIWGEDGDDRILAGAGNDVVYAQAGNDVVYGGAGNDWIGGASGNDRIYGDAGVDTVLGEDGRDTIYGGNDGDHLYGGGDDDYINGGAGNDRIHGDAGNDYLRGSSGDDTIWASYGNDTLDGGDGHDRLYGSYGNDVVRGGAGNDRLYGDSGNDYLYGGSGNDALYGGTGADRLYGEAGNDYLNGGADRTNDYLHGGSGGDRFVDNFFTAFGRTFREDTIADYLWWNDRIVALRTI